MSGAGWYLASSAYSPSNMLMPISRVMTAVVAWPSSVGGSPIMPTRSTPPLRGACASPLPASSPAASTITPSPPRILSRRPRMVSLPWNSARTIPRLPVALVDLDPEAVGQPVRLVGHAHDGHQLAVHLVGHAPAARGGGVRGGAVAAAVGHAHRQVDHLLGERVEGSGLHDRLQGLPRAAQRGRMGGQRLPEVVDVVRLARGHDVVVDDPHLVAGLRVLDHRGRHAWPPPRALARYHAVTAAPAGGPARHGPDSFQTPRSAGPVNRCPGGARPACPAVIFPATWTAGRPWSGLCSVPARRGPRQRYLVENFENLFVLLTLLSTAVVNYLV